MVYDFNANLYKDSIIFLITNKTEGKGSRFLRSLRSVEMTGKRRLTVTMRAVLSSRAEAQPQPRNLTGKSDEKGRPEGQPKDNTCGFPDTVPDTGVSCKVRF